MWPWGACWLRTPGERQAGPRLGIACACAVGRSETLLQVLTVLSVLGVLGVLSV